MASWPTIPILNAISTINVDMLNLILTDLITLIINLRLRNMARINMGMNK